MSFEDIDRNVPLKGTNLFSHSSIVREEAEKFRNNFERNERYKEFDGLIRKNHKLYEANDVFPHLKTESLKLLLDNLKKVDDRLKLVIDMRFNEKELDKLDLSNLSQMDILKLAEAKIQECTPVERLDAIEETDD